MDEGFFCKGLNMAQEYTKEDLRKSNRIYANRLRTQILEEFYLDNLVPKAYIYTLCNNNTIRLIFDINQFCYLLGFSYFGYNGILGWDSLHDKNISISQLYDIANHRQEEIRITSFPKILNILDNPTMYLYENKNMRYKSDYFAVWNDGKRYYKLGIGTTSNGVNYGETYQVSLINSKDNQEIDPSKLLTVNHTSIISKEDLHFPIHIATKEQKNKRGNLSNEEK